MASAISRRPWPAFTTARPAKPSSSFLPRSVHTHTPSARSITSSSSGSHGWSWVLWVHRCLIASPLVVMGAPPRYPPMLSSAHVHRRDRCRGTFTDLTAVDEATGRVVVTKVPSQPLNEGAALLSGLHALGIAGRDVRRLVHGTTVGTNAVLERRGARVAILTTAGFRDLIEIGRTKRNIPALFVPTFVRPKPVVERKHRFEIVERLAADGGVLAGLEERLRATGYAHGVLTVASSGGMMTTETARRLPIKTIFSGPAGGVSQACFVGEVAGVRDFITYDMGGTSTDVCLVRDLAPLTTSDGMLGAFPVKVPQLDMHSVGAGGGSIAWLDVDGSLQVGPRSAGATPGPAAYGLGGPEPTVADANVVLGRIGTTRRLGGAIALHAGRAHSAVADLGARLGRATRAEDLAEGIVRIAVARMTSAIREISIQRGHDPRDFTLIAFGGAGPMHALALAQEIGVPRVLVPRHPGNFSALGLLASDIKHDDVRTRVGPLRERLTVAGALFAEMERAAGHQLELEGFTAHHQRILRSLDLRYRGQAFELNVAVGDAGPDGLAPEAIEAAFHQIGRASCRERV